MKKKIEKGSEEWAIFTDVWNFYQDFAIPEDNDEYWDSLNATATAIDKKYLTSRLSVHLLAAVIDALEDIWNERENK